MQSFASSNFPQSDAAADAVVRRQATIAAEEILYEPVLGLNFQFCDSTDNNNETTCADREILHISYLSLRSQFDLFFKSQKGRKGK